MTNNTTTTMTQAEMQMEIARLTAINNKLRAVKTTNSLSLRVSEKGALSVYGIGRWPVTLYREQWMRLLAIADEIKAFIEANSSRLVTKAENEKVD